MNAASLWRREIAERIAPAYAANPHVAAVILGGSTARGHADKYSDIELGVFWHTPPTDAERQAVVERVGADLIRLYAYIAEEEVWCDDYMIGRRAPAEPKSGILVEAVHYTTEFMQRTFDVVLTQYNPDELKQNLISAVVDGVSLHGAPLIDSWRTRVTDYPEALAMAVVNRHAVIDHFWRWEMFLQRGENLMLLYQSFSYVQQKLLHILLGLNRVYYFGFKWIDVVVERLTIAPANLSHRLRHVYQGSPAEGAQELAALVEETFDLIGEHLPGVDVAWLRQVFRYRRPIWDQAPQRPD